MRDITIKIILESLITEREGMIAENMQRESAGHSMAYTDSEFTKLSGEIYELLDEVETTKGA